MTEQDELRFARLCDGGRLAHFMTPGMMTGVPPRLEYYATRESTWRRFRNRAEQGLPVGEERCALQALYGYMLPAGQTSDGRDFLEAMAEAESGDE